MVQAPLLPPWLLIKCFSMKGMLGVKSPPQHLKVSDGVKLIQGLANIKKEEKNNLLIILNGQEKSTKSTMST